MRFDYTRLKPGDTDVIRELLALFRVAFGDDADYAPEKAPDDGYLNELLGEPACIVLAAKTPEGDVAGGLVAYELRKFEQPRSEIYVYDLAVAAPYRRRGVATALLNRLRAIGKAVGAHVVFVQADTVDTAAVALYTKLSSSVEPDVVHFDIPVGD